MILIFFLHFLFLGSKILEDQLRLMDEKYLELRTKLDYARESGMKKVRAWADHVVQW